MLRRIFRPSWLWWMPVVLIAAGVALAGCEATDRIASGANVLHAGYCQASPEARTALRSVLTFEDGSPKIVVYCQPHGG